MKNASIITVLSFAAALFAFGQPVFADGDNHAEHIAVMRQAANELKNSNADLSKKLNDFADKKEKWAEKEMGPDQVQKKRDDLAKIEQAAEALRPTNAGLADDLKEIHDRWEKKLADKLEKKY
jgi:hypothetical protein